MSLDLHVSLGRPARRPWAGRGDECFRVLSSHPGLKSRGLTGATQQSQKGRPCRTRQGGLSRDPRPEVGARHPRETANAGPYSWRKLADRPACEEQGKRAPGYQRPVATPPGASALLGRRSTGGTGGARPPEERIRFDQYIRVAQQVLRSRAADSSSLCRKLRRSAWEIERRRAGGARIALRPRRAPQPGIRLAEGGGSNPSPDTNSRTTKGRLAAPSLDSRSCGRSVGLKRRGRASRGPAPLFSGTGPSAPTWRGPRFARGRGRPNPGACETHLRPLGTPLSAIRSLEVADFHNPFARPRAKRLSEARPRQATTLLGGRGELRSGAAPQRRNLRQLSPSLDSAGRVDRSGWPAAA